MSRSVEDPSLYINREASWLAFNRRVLEEARDERNPVLERVKFLAITASNMDEFFEVRVAGLLQRIEDGFVDSGPDALTAQQYREPTATETHDFVAQQYACWNQQLLPALAKDDIRVLQLNELDAEQFAFMESYLEKTVDPLLTPVTVDPAHPFPRVLPRLVRLPSRSGIRYIFLADLLTHHAAGMYSGYDILSVASFRVTRNSNL